MGWPDAFWFDSISQAQDITDKSTAAGAVQPPH
jgi:hypothetical protein